MTYKISILTPVHISSGNKNACFLYHPDKNDHFNCYRIEDLLQFIPPQKLLELQPDNASNNGKKDIIKLFNNYVNYNQLKPQYFLFYKFKPFSKDVTEQVKSLNKPYIPGSSIKGAIMNAIIFNLLNDNKEKIKEFLNNFDKRSTKSLQKSLMTYLFGKDFEEIFKLFSSCICCEDIFFDTMILCDSDRLNMKNNNRNQSQEFNKFECIDNLQEKETKLFMIDQTRQKVFLNKYSNKEIIKKLRVFFNKRNIIIACRNYFRTVIKDDKKYFIEDQFDYFKKSDFEGRDQIIEFLNSIYYQKCQSIQVNDFGALNLVSDKNIVLGYHMNITNNKAIQEFNLPFVVSYEASKNEIQSFKTNQDIYFTAYSQIINMNLKHCIISNHYFSRKQKGCHLCKQHQYCLKDRKEMNFKIVTDQYCNNYVLHTHRFYFDKISDLNVDYILLNFLDETSQEIQTIVNDYLNITKHLFSKNKNNYDVFQGYFTK